MTSGCIRQVYFCVFSCSLAAPESRADRRRVLCSMGVLGDRRPGVHRHSATALAMMAEMCFRISSGCRAGASPASGETQQPERLPYKQHAIALLYATKGGA